MDKEEKCCQVKFCCLSGWLKTLVVLGWIGAGFFALAFLVGFIQGMLAL